jgi:hypothetical protein
MASEEELGGPVVLVMLMVRLVVPAPALATSSATALALPVPPATGWAAAWRCGPAAVLAAAFFLLATGVLAPAAQLPVPVCGQAEVAP